MSTALKIELNKLLHRKDTWLLLTIILVSILYVLGIASGSSVVSYNGSGDIDALQFCGQMMVLLHGMFIFYVITAIITARSFATEIEDGSIKLYIHRLKNRNIIFTSKLLSLAIIIFAVFMIFLAITFVLYYIFITPNKDIANGNLFSSNTLLSSVFSLLNILFIFIFTVVFMSVLSMYFKGITSVIIFMILMVAFNLIAEFKVIQLISPWYYINSILSETADVTSVFLQSLIYFAVVNVSMIVWGNFIFKRKDL